MTRTTIAIGLSLAVVLLGLPLGCTSDGTRNPGATTTPVRAGEQEDGQSLGLAIGQNLVVDLPANPSTGYTWVVTALPSVVATVGEPTFASGAAASGTVIGAGGTMTLTFRGIEAGSGRLELGYLRPWEADVAPERTYSLDLNVN